ncbi:hypothetical protein NEMIN01_2483 [Nematocida minor]|uniref:uncharacterized protein n=1 Tax=Nematocida minor TaxID=1912983 RepID=UPI0022201051|nr:uncharacterized protein NEMIN01_2483 [Nematocida minor]KAI5193335.1 hypothetical protein NEMIN01_2483 [Nematocida minor]
MANHKLKGTSGVCMLFALFISRCKGGWDAFSGEEGKEAGLLRDSGEVSDSMCGLDHSSFDLLTNNNSSAWSTCCHGRITGIEGQSGQPEECIVDSSMEESVLNAIGNNPGTSRDESMLECGMEDLDFSFIDLIMNDGSSWNGDYADIIDDVFDQTGQLEQNMVENNIDMGIFSTEADGSAEKAKSMHKIASVIDDSDLVFDDLEADSSIWNALESSISIDEIEQQCSYLQQSAGKASTSKKSSSGESSSAEPFAHIEKRDKSEQNSLNTYPILSSILGDKKNEKEGLLRKDSYAEFVHRESLEIMRKKDDLLRKQRMLRSRRIGDAMEKKGLNTKFWDSRLTVVRRRARDKLNYKTVSEFKSYKIDMIRMVKAEPYQKHLEKDIEYFSVHLAPLVDRNALWYFIASRTTSLNLRHKELFGLMELFRERSDKKDGKDRYIKKVESFKGYYAGVFEDMLEYVKKHGPMRISRGNTPTVWKKTLGDVYMTEHLLPKCSMYEEKSALIHISKKHSALVYAVRMILILPEVYQDFSMITTDLIEETRTAEDAYTNSQNKEVLLKIHKLVHTHMENKADSRVYTELYDALSKVCKGKEPVEPMATSLYKEIYVILAKFYESVEVVDKIKKYVLAGKCVITNQKYVRCEAIVNLAADSCVKNTLYTTYSVEENKWDTMHTVPPHYHVYYIDNTTNSIQPLCMPMYLDKSGQEQYLHTVDEIVDYIKILYKIEECSDAIHPFKVRKGTRKWSYVEKQDRSKTVKGFAEYEVVFYRIDEELEAQKFTFAEFWPLNPHDAGSICVPLFLTPLMQSAVDLGPFTAEEECIELDSIEFEDKVPDVYMYSAKWKEKEYSDVHKYYSNLYIPSDEEKKKNINCYTMNCQIERTDSSFIKIVWYARMSSSADEYTHCALDRAFKEEENAEKFDAFVAALESKEHNQDSNLQAFWLKKSHAPYNEEEGQIYTMYGWLVDRNSNENESKKMRSLECLELEIGKLEDKLKQVVKEQKSLGRFNKIKDTERVKQKKKLISTAKGKLAKKIKTLQRELIYAKLSRKPKAPVDFIVFRNVNHSKSNLGAHNEILDVLTSHFTAKG